MLTAYDLFFEIHTVNLNISGYGAEKVRGTLQFISYLCQYHPLN